MNVDMTVLVALQTKPTMGKPCNNCGWCCLTEVCPVGVDLTGSRKAPCSLLITKDDKHYCKLATNKVIADALDIGGGCDAISTMEKLEILMT